MSLKTSYHDSWQNPEGEPGSVSETVHCDIVYCCISSRNGALMPCERSRTVFSSESCLGLEHAMHNAQPKVTMTQLFRHQSYVIRTCAQAHTHTHTHTYTPVSLSLLFCVCVCVCLCTCTCMSACVCVRERERERHIHTSVSVIVILCVCVCV